MSVATLLPECVLPGCREAVVRVGEPCAGCVEAFGDLLLHNPDGRAMTAVDIEARDRNTRQAYAMHELTKCATDRENGDHDA